MADNITSSATFSTAYMKPAASGGENIDAIWGRNASDNAGYLYYRKTHYGNVHCGFGAQIVEGAGSRTATYYFNHRTEYGTLHGSYVLIGSFNTAIAFGTMYATFFCDGTQIFGTRIGSSGNHSSSTGSFVFTKGHLTHNTDYVFSQMINAGTGTAAFADLHVTLWGVP